MQMPDVDSIKKQLKQRQEAWIRQEKRKELLEQEIRLMDQVIKQQEMQLKITIRNKRIWAASWRKVKKVTNV